MTSKVVGEGTYGCVLKPPILCNETKNLVSQDYVNKISKIMTREHAINENDEYSAINNIEGLDKYAITGPLLCKPLLDKNFNASVKKCKTLKVKNAFKNDKHDLRMLLLEDGGLSIYDHITKVFILQSLDEKKVFLTSLIKLFDGLLFFQSNEIMHRDIKLANMVYNVNNGRAKYIDFGLMTNFKRFARRCSSNTERLGISHTYYAPENSCSNKFSFNSYKLKCTRIKDHFKTHEDFISYLQKSFDIYCLCLALLNMVSILHSKNSGQKKNAISGSFLEDFSILLLDYVKYDVSKRNINILQLKEKYISLLKKYNYYLKKTTQPSPEVIDVIEKIKKKEFKADLAKICPPAKPILNPSTNRCVADCKTGFIRNKSFRCVKMNLAKDLEKDLAKNNSKKKSNSASVTRKKHHTSVVVNSSSIAKKQLCISKNKDYNHITKRCNVKCPKHKTRNSQFKCVSMNK
jgi:serine/threonine protein kinase